MVRGPVTSHDSQVAPETTSNTQVPREDATSSVPPLLIEQDTNTTTEDNPDYTTGNMTDDDTIGVDTNTTGHRSTTVTDRTCTSDNNSARTTVR